MSMTRIGEMNAYVAAPAGTPKAAIIVIPEIFGLNPGIRQKCDTWAAKGYLAVAIDIFWRFAPGVELNPDIEAELNEAFGYFQKYDANDGVLDIETTIKAVRVGLAGHAPVEKIGCVGFCLGGRLAYMAATRTDIDCSVGYYGVMIDTMLNESHAIANPLMLHIPTADHLVGPEAQAAIHAGLENNRHVTLHDYEGLDHGFAAEMGNRRNEDGAQLADGRTAEFFKAHLGD
jgi:carboxymethylenebutenolidase